MFNINNILSDGIPFILGLILGITLTLTLTHTKTKTKKVLITISIIILTLIISIVKNVMVNYNKYKTNICDTNICEPIIIRNCETPTHIFISVTSMIFMIFAPLIYNIIVLLWNIIVEGISKFRKK